MKEVLAKIFGGAGVGVAEKLSNIIGQHVFSKEEKARFEKEMTEVFINAEQEQQKNVTERWKADLEHGNWLTRSVRPLVLVFLIISTVIMVFIDSGSITFTYSTQVADDMA